MICKLTPTGPTSLFPGEACWEQTASKKVALFSSPECPHQQALSYSEVLESTMSPVNHFVLHQFFSQLTWDELRIDYPNQGPNTQHIYSKANLTDHQTCRYPHANYVKIYSTSCTLQTHWGRTNQPGLSNIYTTESIVVSTLQLFVLQLSKVVQQGVVTGRSQQFKVVRPWWPSNRGNRTGSFQM